MDYYQLIMRPVFCLKALWDFSYTAEIASVKRPDHHQPSVHKGNGTPNPASATFENRNGIGP